MDPRTWKRILVPTDFSDPSGEALAAAMAFAELAGATLDLVHVAVEAIYALPPPVDMASLPIDMTRLMERAAEGLAAEESRVRAAGIATDSATLIGRPDTEIVARAAATHADLIVMGTHGRSGLAHALLGSVAERVVQHAHCPVLIVPKRG
jgi:nucleotide-binding universal stress UspA family protein